MQGNNVDILLIFPTILASFMQNQSLLEIKVQLSLFHLIKSITCKGLLILLSSRFFNTFEI